LNRELQQLQQLLVIGEPVNWASTSQKNLVVKSLLCGDEAIIVIVFDNRYFSKQQNNKLYTPVYAKAPKSGKIEVKVPEGFLVSDVKSMYMSLSKNSWNYEEEQLDIMVNMVDSVQVYKVILERTNSVMN
jgi:hypothetical protein